MISFDEKIAKIKQAVHGELDFSDYESTLCRQIVNCYAHAIGSTRAYEEIYRIGLISGKKGISDYYRSAEEIIYLLKEDFKVLELGIEEYAGEELEDNQYLIKLFLKIYRPGRIFDFHFARCDKGVWTEKYRHQKPLVMDELSFSKYKAFPWVEVATYKVTK